MEAAIVASPADRQVKKDQKSGLPLEMMTQRGTLLPLLVMERNSHTHKFCDAKKKGERCRDQSHWDKSFSNYLQVAHRVVWFREEHPDWSIVTHEVEKWQGGCVMRADIIEPAGRTIASALKQETSGDWGDYREKAETGAVGRALALCGFGTAFAPEFDEGERLADSPSQRAKRERQIVDQAAVKDGPQRVGELIPSQLIGGVEPERAASQPTTGNRGSASSSRARKSREAAAPASPQAPSKASAAPTSSPQAPSASVPAPLMKVLLENAEKVSALAADGDTIYLTQQIADAVGIESLPVKASTLTAEQAKNVAAKLFAMRTSGAGPMPQEARNGAA